MADITTTGSGNWNSTTPDAPWPSGTVPAATDNVYIDAGHTVTVTDSDAGTARVATLYIDSASGAFGTLHIATGGYLTTSGEVRGNPSSGKFARIEGRGEGRFRPNFIITNFRGNWDLQGTSKTAPFHFDCQDRGSSHCQILAPSQGNAYGTEIPIIQYVMFDGGGSVTPTGDFRFYCSNIYPHNTIRSNLVTGWADSATLFDGYNPQMRYYDWHFYGSYRPVTNSANRDIYDRCYFGIEGDETTVNSNSVGPAQNTGPYGTDFRNCKFGAAVDEPTTLAGNGFQMMPGALYCAHDGDTDHLLLTGCWEAEHLAAAAYTGVDKGWRLTTADSSESDIQVLRLTILVEFEEGTAFAPKLRYMFRTGTNADADIWVAELDPGNVFGMNQRIVLDESVENSWQQANFTGATYGSGGERRLVALLLLTDGLTDVTDLTPNASAGGGGIDVGEVLNGSDQYVFPSFTSGSHLLALMPHPAGGGGGGGLAGGCIGGGVIRAMGGN